MAENTCYDCALFSKEHHACLRTKAPELSTNHCSHFVAELPTCGVCGQMFLPPATLMMEEGKNDILVLCPQCVQGRNKCVTCQHGKYCDFKENTECTLPPMIQQTLRQENMIMSRTVPNMARVEETCKKNCKCYDAERNCCSRGNFGTCANYEMKGKWM